MFFRKAVSLLTVMSLVLIVTPCSAFAEDFGDAEYAEGEILLSTDKEIEEINGLFSVYEYTESVGINFDRLGIDEINEISEQDGTDNTCYVAETDGDVEEICRKLNRSGSITAEPNYLVETFSYTPPSEMSGNIYRNYMKSYFSDILGIPSVMEEYDTTGEDVTVAVIDNGYNLSFTDFPANLWLNDRNTPGWYPQNNSDDISFCVDSAGNSFSDSFHGTSVASIIGMPSNGRGGFGAAYGSELMLLKVGKTSSHVVSGQTEQYIEIKMDNLISALNFAVDHGADIINMSLGTSASSGNLKIAIDNAYNNGVALFAAAGNGNSQGIGIKASSGRYYPASYPNVIGVMATNNTADTSTGIGMQTTLSVFSNYDETGTYYDVAAPGVGILGGSVTENGYSRASGTSQACPLVSACSALYLSTHPGATVDDLYEAVRESPTKTVASNPQTVTNTTYHFKEFSPAELLAYQPEMIPPGISWNFGVSQYGESNYVDGFPENFGNIVGFLSVSDGYYEFSPTALGNGTGSVIRVYYPNGDLYKTFCVVIHGDLNGDCICDGQDAVILSCIVNRVGSWDEIYSFAGDVYDFTGGSPDNNDIRLIRDHAVGNDYVVQTR